MKCVVCNKNWADCPDWDDRSVLMNERANARFWRLTGLLGGITVALLTVLI